jgi:hypothetical protein
LELAGLRTLIDVAPPPWNARWVATYFCSSTTVTAWSAGPCSAIGTGPSRAGSVAITRPPASRLPRQSPFLKARFGGYSAVLAGESLKNAHRGFLVPDLTLSPFHRNPPVAMPAPAKAGDGLASNQRSRLCVLRGSDPDRPQLLRRLLEEGAGG